MLKVGFLEVWRVGWWGGTVGNQAAMGPGKKFSKKVIFGILDHNLWELNGFCFAEKGFSESKWPINTVHMSS